MVQNGFKNIKKELAFETRTERVLLNLQPSLIKRIEELRQIYLKPDRNKMIYYIIEYARIELEKKAIKELLSNNYD